MTDQPVEREPAPETAESSPSTVSGVFSRLYSRLVTDPVLAVPLLVAGVVVALIGELRRRDPIPARSTAGPANEFEISVELFPVPSGTQATTRTFGGLIDLQPRLLVYGLGLELLGILAVSLAGYLTIARALDAELSVTSAGTYLLYAFLTVGWTWPFGSLEMDLPAGAILLWIPLVVLWFHVIVRLFVVPAALVEGDGIVAAVRRSNAAVRGFGWTVFGVIIVLGLVMWATGFAPVVSTVVGFGVAVLHAVAVAVVFELRTASG